mmetsp:Transcript_48129/g.95004  ORF Transcript_48129/g.95004 Transcript_48129/m.95004 type:complete len:126 (-) Transcript_48129:385-762(-)
MVRDWRWKVNMKGERRTGRSALTTRQTIGSVASALETVCVFMQGTRDFAKSAREAGCVRTASVSGLVGVRSVELQERRQRGAPMDFGNRIAESVLRTSSACMGKCAGRTVYAGTASRKGARTREG